MVYRHSRINRRLGGAETIDLLALLTYLMYDRYTTGSSTMTTINDGLKVQSRSVAEVDRYNFLELPDGKVDTISQAAVSQTLAQKQSMGLPITIWNDGNPYRQYSDGRIEYIQV
jgi:hypothetical protein